MDEGSLDTEKRQENVNVNVAIHEKGNGSIDDNSDPENATQNPFWKRRIDEEHEK